MKISRAFILFIIASLMVTLSGCLLQPRSPNDIPPKLRTLYLDTPNPYSPLSVQLQRLLQSLNVHLTNSAETAPVTLHIMKSEWSDNIQAITYSGNATTYSYTLTTRFELLSRKGKPLIGPTSLRVTRSLIQNANQVYTPNATRLVKREMIRTMVTLIYNQLTSQQTRQMLTKTTSRT